MIYHYDEAGHLIGESAGNGSPIRTYIWRDDVPLAQIDYVPARRVLYFDVDQLNTPRDARDQSGNIVWTWNSDAFGSTAPTGNAVVNLRFPGQYYDQESGLYYNYHRDYDPNSGRYAESDPIGLKGGINTYAYVGGNPLGYVDPNGLDVTIIIGNRAYSSTGKSVAGTIHIISDQTSASFSGYTMENAHTGDNGNKGPIPAGTYDASVRTDHTPNRVELQNVPGYSNIQIHNGNYPRNFKGCFGAGTSHSTDFLGNTVNAMDQINNVIQLDGTGNIKVIVGPVQ